ncbi:bublin coiled-coil protein [Acanthopagrus schlegelii]
MSGPNGDPDMSMNDGIINDDDDFGDAEEYEAINTMLDQINNYLDDLEDRNDSLNGKLHELMESNRQARLEFRAQLFGPPDQEEENSPAEGDESSASKEDTNEDDGEGKKE